LRDTLVFPLLGIGLFLLAWGSLAPQVQTSLGAIPGPAQVWEQAGALWGDHVAERQKEAEFYVRQDDRNSRLVAEGKADEVKVRTYTGKPTYLDQILTSLRTVGLGFLLATLIAVPLGIASGLSRAINGALNPLVQMFKPVSPLAWLPIVTMVVSAVYVDASGGLPKSLRRLGGHGDAVLAVADADQHRTGRRLDRQGSGQCRPGAAAVDLVHHARLVLPSALPLIFTGLRLSLGVGWMVLIAAEMLAQNPGLGKFVWDEFQNGSSPRWPASWSRC
jgi:nitrate/nitrite transport system permease protein